MNPISIHLNRALALPGWRGSTVLLLLLAVTMAGIPSSFATGEADLLTALRGKGAQVVPLGSRGGLAGYFVTPAKGAGYSLYLTATGHAVAGLLYGPDGALVTEDQLAAAGVVETTGTSSNRAGSDADVRGDISTLSPARFDGRPRRDGRCELSGQSAGTANNETAPADPAPINAANAFVPPFDPPPSADRRSNAAIELIPPFSLPRADLLERSAAAFGFTLGERGPLIVLFGDARCPWSRSRRGQARA